MNPTTVRVTDKHIAEGRPGDACACAFACAVIDTLFAEGEAVRNVHVGAPGGEGADDPYAGWRVSVSLWNADAPGPYRALLDREAVDWIGAFDADAPVEPIEVTLTWEAVL